jgi:hypothetical protein
MKGFYLIALFSKPSTEKILSIPNRSFVDGVKFTAMKASFFAFREVFFSILCRKYKILSEKVWHMARQFTESDLKVSHH